MSKCLDVVRLYRSGNINWLEARFYLLALLICILFAPGLIFANPATCEFKCEIKVKKETSSDDLASLLAKMNVRTSNNDKVISKYLVDDGGHVQPFEDLGVDIFNVQTQDGVVILKILSVQTGSAWDHLYLIFKKTLKGWVLLNAFPDSQIKDDDAFKPFEYKNHRFLALVNVQDHGFPWFAIANYDVYLIDDGFKKVGEFISYGDRDSWVLGRTTYKTMDFKCPSEMGCPLEVDLQIDFQAYWGYVGSDNANKYEFDEFKAFSKKARLFYRWNEEIKRFKFDAKQSDLVTDPAKVDLTMIHETEFIKFFYSELEAIALEKNRNKNIWLMSILDRVEDSDLKATGFKAKLSGLMK